MSLLYTAHEKLHELITPLELSIHNHLQWHNALIRTLVCRLPPDLHDCCPKAHKECLFGQWYYNQASKHLRTHPGFIAIGKEHQHMHQLAAQMLATNAITTITPYDYDNFANALERMRLEIFALKRELEDSLYNCDPLTNAINRVNMLPILREQQELAKRVKQSCCIAMMDLDYFKNINDAHGHAYGDKVLVATVHYILDHIRPYDKIFRYGGEEFLLCMPQTELLAGFDIITRLREELSKMVINITSEETTHITASFGVTLLDSTIPVEQSIERADKAMYRAKTTGRNRTIMWEQSM